MPILRAALALTITLGLGACDAQDKATDAGPIPSAKAQGKPGKKTKKGSAPKISTETLERAKAAGISPVRPNTGEAGPLDGPQGTLVYVSTHAKITYYSPAHFTAVFGTQNPGSLLYEVSPAGAYDIRGGQRKLMEDPPGELSTWPKANDVVAAIAAETTRRKKANAEAKAKNAFPGEPLTPYELGRSLTGETLEVDGVSSAGCEDRYERGVYVGCFEE